MPDKTTCHLCDKPAFGNIQGLNKQALPICVEHYVSLQSVENERQRHLADQVRQNMAMMNLAAAQMDSITGLGISPRVAIPAPAPASHYSSVSVSDSVVGVINTAAVGQITAHVGAMPANSQARAAISEITSAVLKAQDLSDDQKRALLDQISVVAAEAAAPADKRKTGLVLPMLSAITQGANAVAALSTTWAAIEPILKAHFGL